MIIDFSSPWPFLIWYAITAGILYASYKTKKAWICLIPTAYFLIILAVSNALREQCLDIYMHRVFNFAGLAVSLSMFLIIDEVETRRKVISQVFKNRYKKDKLPSEEGVSFEENDVSYDEENEVEEKDVEE